MVHYDISIIPPYNGKIGTSTQVKCSHVSVNTAGKTILRTEKEAPIDCLSLLPSTDEIPYVSPVMESKM